MKNDVQVVARLLIEKSSYSELKLVGTDNVAQDFVLIVESVHVVIFHEGLNGIADEIDVGLAVCAISFIDGDGEFCGDFDVKADDCHGFDPSLRGIVVL